MDVSCDKCGSSTTPKEITSKRTGKQYTVYECDGGCMNGQYRYSRFAPSDSYSGSGSSNSSAPASAPSAGNVAAQLRAMDAKLNLILGLLQKKSGAGDIQDAEIIDEMPF